MFRSIVDGAHEVRDTKCGLVTECVTKPRQDQHSSGVRPHQSAVHTLNDVPGTYEGWKETKE